MTEATESPFDHAQYVASNLTLSSLEPGVEYTLVRNNDNSDHGRAESFFTNDTDAARYVTRLKAAFEAGALDQPVFHPFSPAHGDRLDIKVYTVTRVQ